MTEVSDKYKVIFDAFENPIFITSQYAFVMELNKAAKDFSQYDNPKESKTLFQIIPPEMKNQVILFFSSLMINEKKKNSIEVEYSTEKEACHFEVVARSIQFNNEDAYLISFKDIRKKKIFEKKIFEAIIDTEEKERKQFALDLHDELGPFLSGIKLYINELGYDDMDANRRKKLISYLNEMADEAVKTTKSISNKLMPNVLQDYGIIKAVETFTKKLTPLGKINIVVDCANPTKRYEEKTELIIYRILIELINNTIKHSKAKNLSINLKEGKNKLLLLTYRDDGIGFDLEKSIASFKGMGLMSLLSRLRVINGRYNFESTPGQGMNLKIFVYLE